MRQYFQTIPQELAEGGADRRGVAGADLLHDLPAVRPGADDADGGPLALFQTQYAAKWPLMMAAALVSVAPMILVFILAQRHFVSGIAATGLK